MRPIRIYEPDSIVTDPFKKLLYIQVSLTGTLRFTRPTCDCEEVGWVKRSVPVIIQGATQRKPFALEKHSYNRIYSPQM